MSVRKNFVFSEEVAAHLKELALEDGKSMTAVVEEMIEDRYRSNRVKRRLEAFEKFAGSGSGLFGEQTIQSIKENRSV